MRQLQLEHRDWIDKKYPNQPPEIPAAGCVEEAGELLHAVLKQQQVLRWGEDSRYKLPQLREALVDAIGDCGIYACSLCNANNWDFQTFWEDVPPGDTADTELELAITLVVLAASVARLPRSRVSLVMYLQGLRRFAKTVGLDADTAIRVTWLQVKER